MEVVLKNMVSSEVDETLVIKKFESVRKKEIYAYVLIV